MVQPQGNQEVASLMGPVRFQQGASCSGVRGSGSNLIGGVGQRVPFVQDINESLALTSTGIRLGKKRVTPRKQWGEHKAKQRLIGALGPECNSGISCGMWNERMSRL